MPLHRVPSLLHAVGDGGRPAEDLLDEVPSGPAEQARPASTSARPRGSAGRRSVTRSASAPSTPPPSRGSSSRAPARGPRRVRRRGDAEAPRAVARRVPHRAARPARIPRPPLSAVRAAEGASMPPRTRRPPPDPRTIQAEPPSPPRRRRRLAFPRAPARPAPRGFVMPGSCPARTKKWIRQTAPSGSTLDRCQRGSGISRARAIGAARRSLFWRPRGSLTDEWRYEDDAARVYSAARRDARQRAASAGLKPAAFTRRGEPTLTGENSLT